MITRRFVALGTFAVAIGTQLGCSGAGTTHPTGTSDESYTSVANGLWALDGTPEAGDIELLQLSTRTYASIVRDVEPAAMNAGTRAAAPNAASAATATDTARAAIGDVRRVAGASSPTLSLTADDETFTLEESGDTLTLTTADGRVRTYRRSYRLYCVPTDRGVEATVIFELGKEPTLVSVNGDGHSFPKGGGTHSATVRTDPLFRLHEYEIVSHIGASTVIVKLPWSDMSKPEVSGTLAMIGTPDAVPPTPISCERVVPPSY